MSDKPSIHVDTAEKRDGLPEYDQGSKCPHCGGEVETGFGMAGGGFGVYTFCPQCKVVTSKSQDAEC